MTPLSPPAAQGTVAVRDTAIAICEKWLETFAGREIKHIPAHEYAEDAVRDLIDQISAIDVASPSPEALPASGVEDAREGWRLVPNEAADIIERGDLEPVLFRTQNEELRMILYRCRREMEIAALTAAPAPEDRDDA